MQIAQTPSRAVRGAVIVGSLGAIFAALATSGAAPALWRGTLVAMAVFYALVHVAPGALFRLQSMPYTYQVANNFGVRGFDLQNVTYAAYHTHWYNHATHAAFPVEAWLWFVIAAELGGAPLVAALAGLLAWQAFSFGERRLAFGLCGLWAAFAASAAAALHGFGAPLVAAAQLGLVALGFWRFTGHWVEPLPPGIVGNRRFLALADAPRDLRLVWPMLLGYLSEFSAGLPFRLVNSWFFNAAQRAGLSAERGLPIAESAALARRLHAQGWSAHPTTAAIVLAARTLERDDIPRAARAERRKPLMPTVHDSIRLMACDRGASVWLAVIGGRTILFDAWLDDPYVSGSARFFSGKRLESPHLRADDLPALDAIVLSSPEQDHAHPATLARLDPRVPVFAAEAAVPIAERAGFASVTALRPGVPCEVLGDAVSALPLAGYGRNLAIVLRDDRTDERVCFAQHGLNARWLARNAADVFRWQFAPREDGRLVDTLCLGVHTTQMRPLGVPAAWLGDAGTIVPDPSESAAAVARLAPRRVLFSHCTPEAEEGFAVRHLLAYPTAADDVGHAARVLSSRCPGVAIAGLPAPAVWV